jgi:predicted permease
LIAGLAPIVHANRADIAAVLQASGQRSGASGTRTRSILVIAQAALCVVLLIGAGLFVRSVVRLRATPLGFDPDALLWIQPRLRGETLDSLHRAAMRANLLERALRNPSVVNASRVVTVPFYLTFSERLFVSVSGAPKQLTTAMAQVASPGYFATVGTHLIRGRAFDARDNVSAPLVAIVSRQFARAAWGDVDPIGQCLRIGADSMPCRRVIGVADDVHMIGNLAGDPDVMYYLPSDQFDRGGSSLLLRVRGGVSRHADEIRRDLQRAMPGSAYLVATPISETMGPVVRSWRLGATMFVVFGGLALVLATIGLYSVVAYGVAQRTHEIGVRVALGARGADIMSLVIADGLRLLGIGVVLGLGAALVGGRWIAPLLFKVSATDLVTLGSVAATMLAVGAVASGVPARRAANIDPALALRRE